MTIGGGLHDQGPNQVPDRSTFWSRARDSLFWLLILFMGLTAAMTWSMPVILLLTHAAFLAGGIVIGWHAHQNEPFNRLGRRR